VGLKGHLATSSSRDLVFPDIGTVLSSPDTTRFYAAGFTLPHQNSLFYSPFVVSLDANTGDVLWKFTNESYRYTSRSFSGTNIIFMSASGSTVHFMFDCDSEYSTFKTAMVAIDGISGALKWQVEMPRAAMTQTNFFDIPLPALSSQDDLWLPLSDSVVLMASGEIKSNIPIPPEFSWTCGLDPSRSFLLLSTFSSTTYNFSIFNAHSGNFLWQTSIPSSSLIDFFGFPPFKVTTTTFFLPKVDLKANATSLLAFEIATGSSVPGFPVQLSSDLYAQSINIRITTSGSLIFDRLDFNSPSRNFSMALVNPTSGIELWSRNIPKDSFFFYNRISADGNNVILTGVCADPYSRYQPNCSTGAMLGIVNIETGGLIQVAPPVGAVFIYPMSGDSQGGGVITLSGLSTPIPQTIGVTLNAFSSSGVQLWTTGVNEVFKEDNQHGIEVFPVGAFGSSVLISNGTHLICFTVPTPPGGGGASSSTSIKAIVGGTLGGLAGAPLLAAGLYLFRGGMIFGGGETTKVVYTSLSGSEAPV